MLLNLTDLTYTQSILTNNFNTIERYLVYIDLMTSGLCDAEVYISMCDHYVDSLYTLSHIIHRMSHFIRNSTAPAIPLHTRIESKVLKRQMYTHIIVSLFTIAQNGSNPALTNE